MKHHWVSLDEGMSLYMPIAVMADEDQLSLTHRGFDFKQIGMAVEELGKGKRQRGASTIT
jgi:monofunctional biosynthetic peptidoglycan transglycosylase